MSEDQKTLIRSARWVNEGQQAEGDLLISKGRIEKIDSHITLPAGACEIEAEGLWLLPGIIDDQVHFRDYDLSHKGTIRSESRAAASGGVTSVMEMPNTRPPTTTWQAWREKNEKGAANSLINYAFYLGATHENADEVLSQYPEGEICGLKIFMGSSTGNLLVDDPADLERFFSGWPGLIATHCEDEGIVRASLEKARSRYHGHIPASAHPEIRPAEACVKSSRLAVELAERYGTRLHVLHLTTAEEAKAFSDAPLHHKRITSEVCVHHLTFCDEDYQSLGHQIKCNPAIKSAQDREALWKALSEGRIDVIATDHAPHTRQEKAVTDYEAAPAGLPLIQHSLGLMLAHVDAGRLSIEKMVQWMSHHVADCYRIKDRGYLREGYHADLVLVDRSIKPIVGTSDLAYQCGWSPLEGKSMGGRIEHVFVNGHHVVEQGKLHERSAAQPLRFEKLR